MTWSIIEVAMYVETLVPDKANYIKTSTRAGATPGVMQLPVSTSRIIFNRRKT